MIDGSQWIARAASNITIEYFDIRSAFITITHAMSTAITRYWRRIIWPVAERYEELHKGEKNIGSEALSAFMFHKASQPNPFDLLGGMFIMEGLGNRLAGK